MEPEGSLNTPTDSGSPQCHFQEGAKEEQVSWHLHMSPGDNSGHFNMNICSTQLTCLSYCCLRSSEIIKE